MFPMSECEMGMDDGDNDASSKAMNLNSPEVIDSNEQQFLPPQDDNDVVSELSTNFKQEGTSSILSREIKMKNESRRVSFPEDDKIISGYGEPRNPWAKAKTTSTEELIQAYTQSCQHWGIKPITKLLVQLQEIKDFSVRTHSLTLKGEKLDNKVVETLEAVFKRVQFVIMDLEATNLDDDSAAALFDMIEYYESAVNVLIGFNKNLGTRGWQAAAHMMRKMSCLRLFDGHSVPLSDQAVPFVGRALRLSNTLVTLHLECASLSGRPMLLIVAALRMNVTLRELFLADNRLISTDALQIANLLKFNTVLQLLDIRNNLIQDAGLCHLCAGLMSQPHIGAGGGLQTLVLWNNQISHESMGKLAMALKYSPSLSTLNLGQNVLGDDGAAKLKEGLLQNHSLLRLGMVGTKLSCEGAIALAEFLAESLRIIRLDMRNNDIKVGGLMALSLAFKINYSLLRLDIDKPNTKETLKELVEKQESLLHDIYTYSTRNKDMALQKVLNVQLERQRKTEEERTAGLRYMDMTHSAINAGASTSHNNSNNKSPKTVSSMPEKPRLLSTDVDDSPINSPEFLPTNSVSYHQVSPVMFSSSEMEKRAALALSASVMEDSQGDINVQCKQSDEPVSENAEAVSQSDDERTNGELNNDDVGDSVDEAESKMLPQNDIDAKDNSEESQVNDLPENNASLVTPSSGVNEEDSSLNAALSSDDSNPDETNLPFNVSNDETTSEETESCNVTQALDNSNNDVHENLCDETNGTDMQSGDENPRDHDGVTITHFDLSLFPKD